MARETIQHQNDCRAGVCREHVPINLCAKPCTRALVFAKWLGLLIAPLVGAVSDENATARPSVLTATRCWGMAAHTESWYGGAQVSWPRVAPKAVFLSFGRCKAASCANPSQSAAYKVVRRAQGKTSSCAVSSVLQRNGRFRIPSL